MQACFWILRIVAVVALLCLAAAIATPKGRLPLAVRGLRRVLRRDAGLPPPEQTDARVSVARRFLAFVMIVLAALLTAV